MLASVWLMALFFLVLIGWDIYLAVTDVQIYGLSWNIWPNVIRAIWATVMLILYMFNILV